MPRELFKPEEFSSWAQLIGQQRPWATVNAEDWGGGVKPKAEIKELEVRGIMPRKRKR